MQVIQKETQKISPKSKDKEEKDRKNDIEFLSRLFTKID